MAVEIMKNRNRELPTFANINLLGICNANCFFCLGKDISEELAPHNHLNTHFSEWPNFHRFLADCKENGIDKLYFTGQTADGLQYRFLGEAVDTLQSLGFEIGVRTNGYLAMQRFDLIHQMQGEIGYSIHSLKPEVNCIIMGLARIPDWDYLLRYSGPNIRVSIVLNRYNVDEILDIIRFCSQYPNVRYIQVRRISTDTRVEYLQEDIDLYEEFYRKIEATYPRMDDFYCAQRFEIFGKEVNFWRTGETSCNSWNYFTDGTISREYFIVEGYLKNRAEQIHK